MTTKTDNSMTIWEHLEELRWTLIRCIISVVICSIPCGIFWEKILHIFAVVPLHLAEPYPRLIYTAPAEMIMLSLKIAITGGVILASPFVFWQLWKFVSPGLYKNEKRIIIPAVLASTICFIFGFLFCYYMLPYLLHFLTGFTGKDIEPFFRIDEYLNFLIKISFAFGLVFEFPVVSFILTKLRVINHKILINYFRYVLVVIFILGALITPPDVLSQMAVVVPMLLLYGASILISYFVGRIL